MGDAHRRLSGGGGECCLCDFHDEDDWGDSVGLSEDQFYWDFWLHMLSVGILLLFELQIVALMCIYGRDFFKNPYYMLDFVVVGVALVLEWPHGLFEFKGGALVTLLLGWRLLRVVHGLVTS